MENSVLRGIIVFFAWTITSFLCHYCAKLFLRDSVYYFSGLHPVFHYNVVILTCLQIAFCLILRPVPKSGDAGTSSEKYIILFSHACATLTTNYSMAVTHAASTFAIKLTEPLTGALSQSIFLGSSLTPLQWLSIPVTVYGAVIFAEDDRQLDFTISAGTVLAFASNICLALRNVFMKKKHQSKTEIAPTDKTYSIGLAVFCGFCLLLLTGMTLAEITSSRAIYLCILVITSSVFHVSYSYISTVMILKHFSVVSHAFVNIMKRLIVVCLLYMGGSRSATSWNFIGLCICITGLIVYILAKVQSTSTGQEYVSKYSGMATKVLLVSAVFVIGVIFTKSSFVKEKPSSAVKNMPSHEVGNEPLPLGSRERVLRRSASKKIDESGQLSLSHPVNFNIDVFRSTDLVKKPLETNKLSPLLTKTYDVVKEAQRIQMNVFRSELGSYKYAMLFGYEVSEDKGNTAVALGEIVLLSNLNIEVVYACPLGECTEKNLNNAETLSKNYTADKLVILFHGGGNMLSSAASDKCRIELIRRFSDFHIVMFPQSIVNIGPKSHIEECQKLFFSHKRLTIAWMDKHSFEIGQRLFSNIRSLLVPDMAFQVGFTPRYLDPTYDIIWIKRSDNESINYKVPKAPYGYRMVVSDWLQWKTSKGSSSFEDIFLITTTGLTFVQRGRVVITDRLHGHIFSTLLGIPHVFIDYSGTHKIAHYHDTWTASLEHVHVANSSTEAIVQAKKLLEELDKDLPIITGFYVH